MSYTRRRLRICLAVLAWFAQLCLPLAHAAMMAERPVPLSSWCGDPAQVRAFIATLPPELRVEVQPDGAHVHNLSQCATLCALAVTPLLPALTPTVDWQVAEPGPIPVHRWDLVVREPARKPPSQGPPVLG